MTGPTATVPRRTGRDRVLAAVRLCRTASRRVLLPNNRRAAPDRDPARRRTTIRRSAGRLTCCHSRCPARRTAGQTAARHRYASRRPPNVASRQRARCRCVCSRGPHRPTHTATHRPDGRRRARPAVRQAVRRATPPRACPRCAGHLHAPEYPTCRPTAPSCRGVQHRAAQGPCRARGQVPGGRQPSRRGPPPRPRRWPRRRREGIRLARRARLLFLPTRLLAAARARPARERAPRATPGVPARPAAASSARSEAGTSAVASSGSSPAPARPATAGPAGLRAGVRAGARPAERRPAARPDVLASPTLAVAATCASSSATLMPGRARLATTRNASSSNSSRRS